jgi:phosphoribosylformylglycinamidine (FGAM) synthase-like enzyme
VTDCGAGGFSSAVGEMGEEIGAEVNLEKAPLKYAGLLHGDLDLRGPRADGLLAVPPEKWDELEALCASEGVEATVIGAFKPTGRLKLKYQGNEVADLDMEFLHDGRPPVIRDAVYEAPPEQPAAEVENATGDYTGTLKKQILGRSTWQQGMGHPPIRPRSAGRQRAIKPLVGVANDGPGDASVIRPARQLSSRRGW